MNISDPNLLAPLISQSADQNNVATSQRQLNEVVGSAEAVVLSPVYLDFRDSPPPPYDLCQVSNPSIQPTQYPQPIFHFSQHPNVQYQYHQQRLQYPQQENLQYLNEISDYSQSQRMPFLYQREGPVSTPPIKRLSCLTVDTVYLCCCVLPICLLVYLLYFVADSGY